MNKTLLSILTISMVFPLFSCTRNSSNIFIENPESAMLEHTHSFDDAYCMDDTNHWKECSCGAKSEVEPHVYIDGICKDCGYRKPSDGLKYIDLGVAYGVNDIGTCTDTKILIPSNYNGKPVVEIECGAFSNCNNIKNIVIPNSIQYIKDEAFKNCNNLTTIIIPDNVIDIGTNIFQNCTNLINVTLSNNITEIKNKAFDNCIKLQNIIIPDSIIKIGEFAFSECLCLSKITIPESVKSIANTAFRYCNNLDSITVKKGNRFFDSRNDCNAIIESKSDTLVIGSSTTIIPSTIAAIESCAFYGCDSLKEISIPTGITRIEESTFCECISLENVKLPHGLKVISKYSFMKCTSLSKIYFDGKKNEWKSIFKGTNWSLRIPNNCQVICTDGVTSPFIN